MKNPEAAESLRLVGLLEAALLREARLWKVPVFKNGCIQGTDISSVQHQQVILWLGEMSRMFQFCPGTYALGVCVLNRLLSTVKAQTKYLKCIAFTSLVLAAKVNEEDEVLGSVKDLVVRSGCNFSTAEILRMERIILDKLHWDLYTATPVDFIHIFHALLVSGHPNLVPSISLGCGVDSTTDPRMLPADPGHQKRPPGLQVSLWTRQVQHCMACHQLWQFKGSTLALAIITLELEALTPDWFAVFTDLLKKAEINSVEFIHCKEIVDDYLHSLEFALPTNSVYIQNKNSKYASTQLNFFLVYGCQIQGQQEQQVQSPSLCHGLARRGRSSSEQDVDDYYDGFRRLYSEETNPEKGLECLFASEHKGVSPCPPLHPAVN